MIAVVGGTGTAGTATVAALLDGGSEVRILSRNPPDTLPDGASHERFDVTNDDPASALRGVDVLLDLANSSSRSHKVLLDGTGRLLSSCEQAGVAHYIGISIVGCEKVGLGYYRNKARQEQLISESPVGWSLLRASQFHNLIDALMSATARFGVLPAGQALLQPVATEVVGARLARLARGEPLNGVEHVAGPEVLTLSDLAGIWREVTGHRSLRLKLPLPGRTGRALKDGALTDRAAAAPGPGFADWLASRYGSSGE